MPVFTVTTAHLGLAGIIACQWVLTMLLMGGGASIRSNGADVGDYLLIAFLLFLMAAGTVAAHVVIRAS